MVIKKKTVLLIDDDPDFSSLVKTILEAKGMDVVSADSIAEAKIILSKEVPNVILLDMELHNEYGTDFLKERSKNALWAKIPVIVCSSQNLATIVKAAIRFGADDYLLKPIKQTWLIQRIRKNLIKEDNLTFYFEQDEEIDIIVDAKPISVSKTSFIGRSSMGFDKGTVTTVTIPQADGEVAHSDFKSDGKSRFHARGPFDTLFSTVEVTESEKNRVHLLKTFWKV